MEQGIEIERRSLDSNGQSPAVAEVNESPVEIPEESSEIKNGIANQLDEKGKPVFITVTDAPPWWQQITIRGVALSALLGFIFCIITLKLGLTTGIIPALNVSVGLLVFFLLKSWTAILSRLGIAHKPFTRQENTVIQTCAVACCGLAYRGGFASYILAMDRTCYDNINRSKASLADNPADVKNPSLGWIIGYMFAVGFLGLLAIVPLRKIMIIKLKLAYPNGTATAMLINGFHSPYGAEQARKQIICFGKYFSFSFLWSFFKWFFSGGQRCGFDKFPSLGLKAFNKKFYFDFSMTYVGAGMICPPLVNCSLLLGAIASWGIMWPLVGNHSGDWYPADLTDIGVKDPYGYKALKTC